MLMLQMWALGVSSSAAMALGGSIGLADAVRLVFRGDANDGGVDSAVAIFWLDVGRAKFKAFNFRDFHEIAVFKAEQSRAAAHTRPVRNGAAILITPPQGPKSVIPAVLIDCGLPCLAS